MNTHADKTQDNKIRSVANERSQKQSSGKSTVHFVDNRPEAVSQRKLQEIANNNPQAMQLKAFQEMAYDSRQIKQAVQLQAVANSHPEEQTPRTQHDNTTHPIQRVKNVYLGTDTNKKKSLSSEGTVDEFKDGSGPGTEGWVGVTKYRARYQIDSIDGKFTNTGEVGPLKNTFTNPEAGHVLAKQNGGNGGDAENIFAQDGGTNNGKYKSFEIDMRKKMNLYGEKDEVKFKSYLVGKNIKKGTISDAGLSDASGISSDDDESD